MHNAVVVIVLTCVVLPIIAYSPLEKRCSNKKLLSFNAGLAPSSAPYVDERRPFLVPELRKLNSDVICLQDVYYGSDVKNTALHLMFSGYPYSYSSLHDERGRLKWGLIQSKPCNGDVSVETTLECLDHVCKKDFHTVEDILHCGVKHCKLLDLTDNCISCILVSGMDDVTNKCVDGMSATHINIPGLMILSKKPFLTTKRVQFFPEARQIFSKEYLQADIYGLGEVICTHLTNNNSRVKALLDTFYLDGETQNLVETMKLLRSLQGKKDVLLMGNLNTGPSIPSEGVEAKSQFSFTQFMQNNLRSPYAEIVGKPTICPDGNSIADDNASIVDHILTKGYKIENAEVQRVLDKNLPGKDYPLSKHYGVQVTVETNCDHDDESINH